MYTTNGEKQAARALQGFEQVRSFFLKKRGVREQREEVTRIIAFSSESEYKPYRFNKGSFAYYQRSPERDYIVMQDIESEHHRAAFHEYTHLIIEHGDLKLPVWLNEGLAEVYSSLEPRGNQAMVGRVVPEHYALLQNSTLIPWNEFWAVDQQSAYYNRRDKMPLFYAQSWLLTHMLVLGEEYHTKLPAFLAAINGGSGAEQAFQTVYGKSARDVSKDAEMYLKRQTVRAALFDFKLQKSELDPQVRQLSDFEVRYALADLLSNRTDKAAEAHQRLSDLAKEDPQNFEVEQSLAYLAWRQKQPAEAAMHFERALELGSQDAGAIYSYAGLEQSMGQLKRAMQLLQQVIALDPERSDAKVRLMSVAASQAQFGFALEIASQVHAVKHDDAFTYYSTAAYCHANLKDPDGARTLAHKALSYASDDRERQQINKLLDALEERTGPP
jgi:tetratricopeptide (TPR) repeat protein